MAERLLQNQIHKVLSLIQKNGVRCLLIGGQACVLYGGAEFSKDFDFSFFISDQNVVSLKLFLNEIQAEPIAVPDFDISYLERGHALHFRSKHEDYKDIRIDIMSKMRGVDDFEKIYERRTTLEYLPNQTVEVMGLPDLVKSKKTQRDKDWPMIRLLLEADYFQNKDTTQENFIEFWLLESRTPEILLELKQKYSSLVKKLIKHRSLLALSTNSEIEQALKDEEHKERQIDKAYWEPLKKELEILRHKKK